MPRIPVAMAVALTLTFCTGLNVVRYPVVFEMAAPARLAAASNSPPPAASAAAPFAQRTIKPTSPESSQAAYCTADGVCYTTEGEPLAKAGKKPSGKDEVKIARAEKLLVASPSPVVGTEARPGPAGPNLPKKSPLSEDGTSGKPKQRAAKAQEKTPEAAQQSTAVEGAKAERRLVPVVRSGSTRSRVARLPKAPETIVLDPPQRTDWIPVYPTTTTPEAVVIQPLVEAPPPPVRSARRPQA